jgi:hypothetical protein
MRTAIELGRGGGAHSVFHRTATAAWTHAPGERYRYRGGRHGAERWIEMPCPCAESTPHIALARRDANEGGERPERSTAEPDPRTKAGTA